MARLMGGYAVPVPGSVLVQNSEKKTIGVVEVTSDTANNDEHAAVAGIVAADLVASP